MPNVAWGSFAVGLLLGLVACWYLQKRKVAG